MGSCPSNIADSSQTGPQKPPQPKPNTRRRRPPPQVGMGGMECYEKDFEEPLLHETAAYYKRKAAEWIAADSCPEYMVKAEECLRLEEERVEHYLHAATKPKLLKEVRGTCGWGVLCVCGGRGASGWGVGDLGCW